MVHAVEELAADVALDEPMRLSTAVGAVYTGNSANTYRLVQLRV